MSDNVITVENLSKRYVISHQAAGTGGRYKYKRFSDVLIHAAQSPLRALQKKRTYDATHEEFWALKDVSFEVKRGDVIGIIGRNGAGKSTLLKILSRITEPSSGRVEIEGRVASLLEVGTGFHPELTGRENIYLNGAILGMTRAEIKKKFDEIVAFAEVEKFLDTPVKHFSSGMYVRLAFAVAAHLEPEILIVDEVLAVGDAQFQKKCLGKMQDVSTKEGRTVLFVSHNMSAVMRLCSSLIWLRDGKIAQIGVTSHVISAYQCTTKEESRLVSLISKPRQNGRPETQRAFFTSVAQGKENSETWIFPFGDPLLMRVGFVTNKLLSNIDFLYAIFSASDLEIASARCAVNSDGMPAKAGKYEVTFSIPHLRLVPGVYYLNLAIQSEHGSEDFVAQAVGFEVVSTTESAKNQVEHIRAVCVPETHIEVVGPQV